MLQKNPIFSVLIANYNNGKYLMEAIESVRMQTYSNWEIILVDDGSTDNSHELYKELENDPRIHIYYNEKNMGCGYTKRRCTELANGEICGFLDPDDALCDSQALHIMESNHKQHKNASLVYSDYYCTNENFETTHIVHNKSIPQNSSVLFTKDWPIGHWCTFKTNLYRKTDGIDAFMERAVDYDMYYKLEEVGKVIHIDHILYKYRNTPQSISLNHNLYKAHIWHCYACANALKRRGIRNEKIAHFPIEYDLQSFHLAGIQKGEFNIRQTFSYRIGKLILKPFVLTKRIFQNFSKS